MSIRLSDILFLSLAGIFCLAALCGVQELSPGGVYMDSDLQNYTQILAQQLEPSAFKADPVASDFAHFPGMPNLLTILAGWLAMGDGAVPGIFRACALTLWLYLAGYYLLGRWLFKSRGLAIVLTALMTVTVYWAFGTFWGASHADPVPRVLYAGLCFPLWLRLGCEAVRKAWMRPCLLLLIGCSIGVHSVSAIACAAMFLMAFLLSPGKRTCLGNCLHVLLCALAFLAAALPLLKLLAGGCAAPASSQDLALLKEVWQAMASNDLASPWLSLGRVLRRYAAVEPLLPAGLACFAAAWMCRARLPEQAKRLLTMMPAFVLGLAGMLLLCLAEAHLASRLGYNQMSQDLFRGTRFLVPLIWLSIVLSVACFWKRLPSFFRMGIPALACIFVVFASQDKQCVAARHAAAELLRMEVLEPACFAQRRALALSCKEALDALKERSAPGELVYTDASDLAVRYAARRPLAATFKDGWLLYYARDMRRIEPWLAEYNARRRVAGEGIHAFHAGLASVSEKPSLGWRPEESQAEDAMARISLQFASVHRAAWLLVRADASMLRLLPRESIVFSNGQWIVASGRVLWPDSLRQPVPDAREKAKSCGGPATAWTSSRP